MAPSPSRPARDLYAEAAARLGRELTPGERLVDVARLDALLERAKEDLAAAIEKEKSAAIRRWLNGETDVPRLDVTPAMQKVLAQLYADGAVLAMDEIRAHGFEPAVPEPDGPALFAESKRTVEGRIRAAAARFLERVRAGLPRYLGGIEARIVEHGTALDVGEVSTDVIAREMERQVPGSLDVAGRLVSTALYAGMGGVYEANADLFREGWTYSAIMDGATCLVCAAADGTHYDTWDEGMADLPDGGPNPECFGDGRCRCRMIPEPVDPASRLPDDGTDLST